MIQTAKKHRSRIMQFLNENGWERQKSKDGALVRYTKKDNTLKAPVNVYFTLQGMDDAAMRNESIEAEAIIRQFYGVPFSATRTSLGSGPRSRMTGKQSSDRISTRVPDRYVNDDTIEVSIATETITYLKSLIDGASRATAQDELTSGISSSDMRDYVRSCRFAHTFQGSFGFQIECPLENPEQLSFDIFDHQLPFGRLVSERIARGFKSVVQAALLDSPEVIAQQDKGFDGRMCKQLADYMERTQLTSVYLGVELDQEVAPITEDPISSYRLQSHYSHLLREAQRILEPVEKDQRVNIVGRVVQLKAQGRPLEDEGAQREITIAWETEGGRKNVSANLLQDQYAQAIRAHEQGSHVQVKCMLVREGGRKILSDITSFIILD